MSAEILIGDSEVARLVPQPGPLLVAAEPRTSPQCLFDTASLAIDENSDSAALYATDFQPGPSGFVRVLVADNMSPGRAGALAQRVIELETYRTLAAFSIWWTVRSIRKKHIAGED